MAAAKRVMAGTVFSIGTQSLTPATDTYVAIAGAKQIGGDLGGSFAVVDTTDLDDTIKQETKTLLDAGTIDLEMHEVPADAGQVALEAAFLDTDDIPYNFQIAYPSGDKRRCKAKVISRQPMAGNAGAVRMVRAKLSLTAIPAYVAAA